MPNIKFNYLYRDSGNYKVFNSVIFKNDLHISLKELDDLIKSKLLVLVGVVTNKHRNAHDVFH